ncbi:MAG: anthranilate synthase component I family protein [Candidatus Margulisbacteria bacterium]|nr:anthranilate synthase component I family protein [Candidatus Margulisiibacteriota bacterium]
MAYDCCGFIENLPDRAKNDLATPDFLFIVPEKVDVGTGFIPVRNIRTTTRVVPTSNFQKQDFENTVQKAKEYIAAGDIYQVNLSQRLEIEFKGDPLELYQRLSLINPSPFASYFDLGDFQIISSSPERLIKLENGIANTRPIAGTRPSWAKEADLILNEKERAEHIMLVDLERNDLGRVCEYNSVLVNEKMVIEHYSHVMHIVSNVTGKLKADKNWFDLLCAMFPGGTITGCPKIRSMEIIEKLEPVKRGIYTGSLGYIDPQTQTMDMNIVIRTIVLKENKAYVQVGAGIVADSDPEQEYLETLHKAQAMLDALAI